MATKDGEWLPKYNYKWEMASRTMASEGKHEGMLIIYYSIVLPVYFGSGMN